MNQVSATQASRRFSEMLDRVERSGETFLVVRHGRPIATIGPAEGATGKALKEALRTHQPERSWVDRLREIREGPSQESDSWRV